MLEIRPTTDEELTTYIRKQTEHLKEHDKYEKEIKILQSQQDGSHAIPHAAFFVGGKYHGLYKTHQELMKMGNGNYTMRWSVLPTHNDLLINLDLEDQPMIDGYLSPMWEGRYLRYETQEVYDAMFD